MSCFKVFNFVSCVILFSVIFDMVHSRFVYRPDIQREIKQDKVVATWQEAKEHCESQGAILASPIDAAHLHYMRSYIEVNDHTSAYFTGYKAVIHDDDFNYISVEGIFLDELPDAVINMIEKIDPEDGDCLSMDHREIRAVPCWERLPYICYTKVTNENSNVTRQEYRIEERTVVLPELLLGKPTDVIAEVTANVSVEASPSEEVNVITEGTTSMPVQVTTEVIPDAPIELYSSELVDPIIEAGRDISVEASSIVPVDTVTEVIPNVSIEVSRSEPAEVTTEPVDVTTEVRPDAPTELSLSELVDTSVQVTTDISMEASSIVPVDMATVLSSNEQGEETSDLLEDTTYIMSEATPSDLPDVPVETTEATIDVRINDADEQENPSSGYSFYNTGSLYKLHDAPLPWANANDTCAREGGYLAVINDDAEAQVLAELGNIYPHVVWIGLKKEHGDWLSVLDDNLEDIFNKWSIIIRANYECGVIMSTGVLDDRDCEYPLPFICEKNVVPNDVEVY